MTVRRPVAWIVAVVLFVEAVGVAALNWFLGVVVDRQDMSLAGLDPDVMSMSSKIGGIVFGLYFALCALVALLVALRDRPPAGLGRVLLISAAVVHGLLGAFGWGLVGPGAFVCMIVVLGLVVLLLMTYDIHEEPAAGRSLGGPPADGPPADGPPADGWPGSGRPEDGKGGGGSPVSSPPAPTTP